MNGEVTPIPRYPETPLSPSQIPSLLDTKTESQGDDPLLELARARKNSEADSDLGSECLSFAYSSARGSDVGHRNEGDTANRTDHVTVVKAITAEDLGQSMRSEQLPFGSITERVGQTEGAARKIQKKDLLK